MMKVISSIAAGAVALALAAPVLAGNHEDTAVSGKVVFSGPSAVKFTKKAAKVAPGGCPEGYYADNSDGEVGTVCRSKNPASVTCRVLACETITDDSGSYCFPSKTECTPPQGWGGSGNNEVPPQAP